MTYTTNIPAATDLISNSQAQLQGNCNAIDSGTTGTGFGFSRNHITMTDATNGGLHNRVDFFQNVADPAIAGFTSSVYTKSGSTGNSELFYKSSASTVTQITGVAASAGSSGTVPMAGGLIMMWGNNSVATGAGTTINFPNGGFPNNCYSVVISILDPNPSASKVQVKGGSVSKTSFVVITQTANTAVYWQAIGN